MRGQPPAEPMMRRRSNQCVCAPRNPADKISTAAQQRTQHSAQRRTAAHPAGTCGRRARTCAARSCRRPSTRPGARSSPLGTRRRGSSRCPLTRTRRSLVCFVGWLWLCCLWRVSRGVAKRGDALRSCCTPICARRRGAARGAQCRLDATLVAPPFLRSNASKLLPGCSLRPQTAGSVDALHVRKGE